MRTPAKCAFAGTLAVALTAASDTVQLTPGRWQNTLKSTSTTIDGAPAPAKHLQKDQEESYDCITPEQARNPAQYFLFEDDPDDECSALR